MTATVLTVIIPCRNEGAFIERCLDSVVNAHVPNAVLEVLVVDGMSTDGTREIASRYAASFPSIQVIDNPRRTAPTAMNLGIRRSRGSHLARLDAHTVYPRDYLARCLAVALETGADNVGGCVVTRPRRNTPIGRAIALVLAHPFGAGNSYFRTGTAGRRWVDTVPFGLYRRDVFERVGLFNEELVRGQDMEFNLRLTRAGGRILLDPEITSDYYARSTLREFVRHNFADGFWVTYALRFAKLPVSWRHLVPLTFVSSLIGGAALAVVLPVFRILLLIDVLLYAGAVAYFSTRAARREGRWEYVATLPVAFATRHVAYGIGSLWGLVRLLGPRDRRNDASAEEAGSRSSAGVTPPSS